MRRPILTVLLLALAFVTAGPVRAEKVPGSRHEMMLSFAPLVEQVTPAVVNIYAARMVKARTNPLLDDPFFRRFFGDSLGGRPRQQEVSSLGSGVIVAADGMVVTNNHVVADAEDIKVVLHDRREFEARIVLRDEQTDMAVLTIETGGERLPFLEFHDSDDLRVGDLVLAIGNPFGIGQTVTSGIISGLSRTRVADNGGPQSFIQTDAAINPGNSGGALVTVDGRLAGINTAIFSRSGGSHGVGFAIPANLVAAVVRGARNGTGIVRAWVGMVGQEVTSDIALNLGLDRPGGVLVADVYPGGPADRAGLQSGDVILSVGGRPVGDPVEMQFRLATRPIGGEAELEVRRRGRNVVLALPLQPAPEVPPRNLTDLKGTHPLNGATVANLSPKLAEEVGFDTLARGVVVMGIGRGTPAARFDVRPGDIIRRVNGQEITRVDGLDRLLSEVREAWAIDLQRGDRVLTVRVRRTQ
ncbi:MAG: Do family serine endopeptidase [Pseudomonadota bacterium]|nr:Do family serine endopeptidase [Pseudomonadota bacterium]